MKKYLYLMLLVFILPVLSFAQGNGTTQPPPGTGGTTQQPSSNTNINVNIPNPTNAGSNIMQILIALLNNVVMPIAAVAVVMWIIWAGFGYLTAQGKPGEIQKANQRLMWSLIGGGILLGAVGISQVVENTINSLLN